ncbi:MAG: adventurous gliding motility protein CglF [Deltaproteobacteria bacterium]|nr:adventurous gliding motility protein CglF [Deltaproteobacteria bacterium]
MTQVQKLFVALFLGGSVMAPALAEAQEEAGVIYQKKTTVSFEEDTIDGDLTRPDATYVEARKRVRHSNLIRIRENFREQVLRSVSRL